MQAGEFYLSNKLEKAPASERCDECLLTDLEWVPFSRRQGPVSTDDWVAPLDSPARYNVWVKSLFTQRFPTSSRILGTWWDVHAFF